MAGIYENLDTIEQIKTELKTALEDKGVDMVGTTFSEYPQKIQDFTPKIRLADYGVKLNYGTFVEVPEWADFDGVTDMSEMFANCQNLQNFTFSVAPYVTSITQMFQSCSSLTQCNITGNLSSVTDASRLFYGCKKLEVVGNFDMPNVTAINNMFAGCTVLTTIGYIKYVDKIDNQSKINMFNATMNNLTNVGGLIGQKQTATSLWTRCPNLNYQSCINILNGLYDFTGNGETPTSSQGTLRVHSNFLTAVGDEISIGTNKGWTITA